MISLIMFLLQESSTGFNLRLSPKGGTMKWKHSVMFQPMRTAKSSAHRGESIPLSPVMLWFSPSSAVPPVSALLASLGPLRAAACT